MLALSLYQHLNVLYVQVRECNETKDKSYYRKSAYSGSFLEKKKKRKEKEEQNSLRRTHTPSFSLFLVPSRLSPPPSLSLSLSLWSTSVILDTSFIILFVAFPFSPPQATFSKCPRIRDYNRKTYFVNLPSPYMYNVRYSFNLY